MISATATISGGSSSIRFEMLPALDVSTAIPQHKIINENDIVVSSKLNELTIKVNNSILKDFEAQIYSTSGKLIFQKNSQANTIKFNTATLLKGCYFVKVTQGQKIYNKKIIIN